MNRSMRQQQGRASTLLIVLLVLALAGAATWYLAQQRGIYRISAAQLNERLAAKLPVTDTLLYLFTVTLDNPQVELVDSSDRINAGLDLALDIELLELTEPLLGRVDASAGIRYDPSEAAFYLADPRIEHISLDDLPLEFVSRSNGIVAAALDAHFERQPIYRLNAKQARRVPASVDLQVVVEEDELVLRLARRTERRTD